MSRTPSVTIDSRAGISVMFRSCQDNESSGTASHQATR
jgi:hypothetical protein